MKLIDRFILAEKKGLSGFTIWPSKGGWQVSIQFKKGGWYISTNKDLETAILGALKHGKK